MKPKTPREKQTQQDRRLLLGSILFPKNRQTQIDQRQSSQGKNIQDMMFTEGDTQLLPETDDDLSLVDNNETAVIMEPKFKASHSYLNQQSEQVQKGNKSQRIVFSQPKQTQALPIETQTDFDETFLGREQQSEFFAISQENLQLQQHLTEQNQKMKMEELSLRQQEKKNEQKYPQFHFKNSYSVFQQSPQDKLIEEQQLPYQLTSQFTFKQKIKKDTAYRLTLKKHSQNNNNSISSDIIKSPSQQSLSLQKPSHITNSIIRHTSQETKAALQIAEDMNLLSSSSSNPFLYPYSIERRKTDSITSNREKIQLKTQDSQPFPPQFILLTGSNDNRSKDRARTSSSQEQINLRKREKPKHTQQQHQKSMTQTENKINKCDLRLAGQSFSKRVMYSKPINSSLKYETGTQQSGLSPFLSQFPPANSLGIPRLESYVHQRYHTGVSYLELPPKMNNSMDYSSEMGKDLNQSNNSVSVTSNYTITSKNLFQRECQFISPTVFDYNKKKSVSQCNFTDTPSKSINKPQTKVKFIPNDFSIYTKGLNLSQESPINHNILSFQTPERLVNSFISDSYSRKSTSPQKIPKEEKQQQNLSQYHGVNITNNTRRQHNYTISLSNTQNHSQRLSFSQEKLINHPNLQLDCFKQSLTDRVIIKGKTKKSQEDRQQIGTQLFLSIKGKTQSKSYLAQGLY